MNSTRATVSKILTYSIVDGPGNRLVVFLQGCNFKCAACHNPHTIGECNHCGECIPACHVDALSLVDGRIAYDPTDCDHCDACLDICPISANPMVRDVSIAEILELAREHRPFLTGITVSGGEPTKQLDFIIELFRAIKADRELAERVAAELRRWGLAVDDSAGVPLSGTPNANTSTRPLPSTPRIAGAAASSMVCPAPVVRRPARCSVSSAAFNRLSTIKPLKRPTTIAILALLTVRSPSILLASVILLLLV